MAACRLFALRHVHSDGMATCKEEQLSIQNTTWLHGLTYRNAGVVMSTNNPEGTHSQTLSVFYYLPNCVFST